jgi:N-glycosylase/DNA lyase
MAYYSFPGADKLSEAGMEELEACRGGFRCKYILNTARMVKNGEVRLEELEGMDTGKAREELMKFPGVGPKVADCVLLYSGTKQDVFPTDVWVKRVMEELYFKREASFKEIQDFASSYFGDLAGFAQQYLFYYARENRIGTI